MAWRFSPRVCSRDTRDSSPAVAAGDPQRWRPCCRPNLACGRWLVRSSLGSRGIGAEEGQGTLGGGWGGGRYSSVDRNRVCNLRGVRPLRSEPPSLPRLLESVLLNPLPLPQPLSFPVLRISRIRTHGPKRRGWMRCCRLSAFDTQQWKRRTRMVNPDYSAS